MDPFAVFKGTTDDDGKFLKLEHPGHRPARYRVQMWVEAADETRLTDEYITNRPCRLNDLMVQTITPAVDDLIAEARQHGGTLRYGFSCFKWG